MIILRKIDTGLQHFGEFISSMCMLAMALIVTAAVIARQLGIQFIAADELARYVMIWSVYIGIIICTRHKAHVLVDILPNALKGNAKKILLIITHIIIILTLVWLFKLSIDLVAHAVGNGQKAPITKIPYWFMYSSMSIGLGMSFLRQIQVMVKDICLSHKKSFNSGKDIAPCINGEGSE